MSTNIIHTNIRRLVAVVVAGGVFGVAGVYALASAEQAPSPAGHDQRPLAEWAQTRRLSGLSPASLTNAPTAQPSSAEIADRQRQIAEWAEARGLSGLSPASLRVVDD